jgi:hypothetical protein
MNKAHEQGKNEAAHEEQPAPEGEQQGDIEALSEQYQESMDRLGDGLGLSSAGGPAI